MARDDGEKSRCDGDGSATPSPRAAHRAREGISAACNESLHSFPRLLRATPESLLDATGVLDPAKAVAAMLVGEKPGGHAERSNAWRRDRKSVV